ncbi:MAG TPA: regulatory protein GemA [Gammaproteobacteria bacterium]|jgi:phage gp16-like protein|nr:regulatory protein GemA [Gammaproteobacteria bacterium]
MRNNDLAKIHIAKKDLCLSDDDYRAVLWAVCRVRSSAALDVAGRGKLLQHFKSRGWKPQRRRVGPKSKRGAVDKIRALWITMSQQGIVRDASETALSAFIEKTTAKHNDGRGIQQAEWLRTEPELASFVIEQLKQWQRRELRKRKEKVNE